MKIAVRYYTKTGNTKRLAEAVAKAVGAEALPLESPLTEPVDVLFLKQVIQRPQHKRKVIGLVLQLTQAGCVSLKRPDAGEPFAVFPQNRKIAFHQFHRGNIHAFLCQRDGIPACSGADLQHPGPRPGEPVNIMHGDGVFQLAVPASLKPAVFIGLLIETADNFNS